MKFYFVKILYLCMENVTNLRKVQVCMKQFAHRINIYSIRFISWCFATFLLLSYGKVVGVSFDLLVPMLMCKVNGNSLGQYLNYHDAADQACLEQFRIQSYLAANLTCMLIRAKFSWKASLGQALPSRKKPDISLSIMMVKHLCFTFTLVHASLSQNTMAYLIAFYM